MKVKFGTQLDNSIYDQLKVASATEHRAIGEIVQTALADYLRRSRPGRGRKTGLARLLERDPLRINDQQFRVSMEEDFYDQGTLTTSSVVVASLWTPTFCSMPSSIGHANAGPFWHVANRVVSRGSLVRSCWPRLRIAA